VKKNSKNTQATHLGEGAFDVYRTPKKKKIAIEKRWSRDVERTLLRAGGGRRGLRKNNKQKKKKK